MFARRPNHRKSAAGSREIAAAALILSVPLGNRRPDGSPLAARHRALAAGDELLAEDQIVHIPVLPNTAPNAVGLTLHHGHAVHLLAFDMLYCKP